MSLPEETREDVRDMLTEDLIEVLDMVQEVYGYQKSDFAQLSPIVRVLSDGTLLQELSFDSYQLTYYFVIQAWVVRYSEQFGWTEQKAEQLIDAIDYKVMQYLAGDTSARPWMSIAMTDRATVSVGSNQVAGEMFLVEDIPIAVIMASS